MSMCFKTKWASTHDYTVLRLRVVYYYDISLEGTQSIYQLDIFQNLIKDLYLPHMDRRKFAFVSSTPLVVAELTMKNMGTKNPSIQKQ